MNKFLTRDFFSTYIGMVSGQFPLKENCLPVRGGVWVKLRVSFRVGGNQTIAPEENCPQLGLGFGLGLVLGLGGNFPQEQLS